MRWPCVACKMHYSRLTGVIIFSCCVVTEFSKHKSSMTALHQALVWSVSSEFNAQPDYALADVCSAAGGSSLSTEVHLSIPVCSPIRMRCKLAGDTAQVAKMTCTMHALIFYDVNGSDAYD